MTSGRYAELFLSESREHLSVVNDALLELERGKQPSDAVRELFRAVHSMKGMAGAMGFRSVADLAHEMESLLDALRSGRQSVDAERMDALFAAADLLGDAVAAAMDGEEGEVDCRALLERLSALAGGEGAAAAAGAARPMEDATSRVGIGAGAVADAWSVVVHQDPHAALRGARAFLAVRRLEGMGELVAVHPPLEAIQAGSHGESFTVLIRPTPGVGVVQLEQAARSAGDVTRVEVREPDRAGPSGTRAWREGAPMAGRDAATVLPAGPVRIGDAAGAAGPVSRSVRVDVRHLDSLLDLAGELQIGRERLVEALGTGNQSAVRDSLTHLSRLISGLQQEVLEARLVPVWQVFDRFPRVVRDAARALGREVDFRVEGKEIELDRSLLDEIGEPVVHLLRNAVDHGLEPPEERLAAGKPRAGRLTLSAVRDRDSVLVRVSDDGRGLDRARVVARARSSGLLAEGEEPDAQGLIRLVSRPGFSTAEHVTEISGRGVGMDAVHERLRSLGGSVEMQTEPGRGTTVTLRMPLTLAIVRTLLARVGEEVYALPVSQVVGTADLASAERGSVGGQSVLSVGGGMLPAMDLRELVGLPEGGPIERELIIVQSQDQRLGLVVDELLGEQEAVVKRFDPVRGGLAFFSGATVLGNGMPTLIVDVGRLLT